MTYVIRILQFITKRTRSFSVRNGLDQTGRSLPWAISQMYG